MLQDRSQRPDARRVVPAGLAVRHEQRERLVGELLGRPLVGGHELRLREQPGLRRPGPDRPEHRLARSPLRPVARREAELGVDPLRVLRVGRELLLARLRRHARRARVSARAPHPSAASRACIMCSALGRLQRPARWSGPPRSPAHRIVQTSELVQDAYFPGFEEVDAVAQLGQLAGQDGIDGLSQACNDAL